VIQAVRGVLTPLQQKVLLAVLVLFLASLYFLRTIYIPVFIAYFLAFLLNPLVRWLEKKGFGRVGPIFLLLSVFFTAVILLSITMLPRVIGQVRELFDKLPLLMDFFSLRLGPYSLRYLGVDVFIQWKEMLPSLAPSADPLPAAANFMEALSSGAGRAISTILSILLIPILTFYILKNYYILNERLMELVPRRYLPDVREVMRRLSLVLGGLIRGQFLICAVLAAYYSFVLSNVGVELALLLGILSGLLNLVPFVGPVVSLALTLFLASLSGGTLSQAMAIVGVYLVANLLDTAILTPKIVGKQMRVSPMTIILALLAGAELLGFLGVLLALPMMAMVKVLWGYLQERYLESSYYREEAPVEGRQTLSEGL
jgi:predicted PurR-regulated permease PerM